MHGLAAGGVLGVLVLSPERACAGRIEEAALIGLGLDGKVAERT